MNQIPKKPGNCFSFERPEMLWERRAALGAAIRTGPEELFYGSGVVASFGLAEYDPGSDHSFHDVFRRADQLMYERRMQRKSMGAVTRD